MTTLMTLFAIAIAGAVFLAGLFLAAAVVKLAFHLILIPFKLLLIPFAVLFVIVKVGFILALVAFSVLILIPIAVMIGLMVAPFALIAALT